MSYAADVNHLLANAQTVLGCAGERGLSAAECSRLNEMLRRFREERAEPELDRTPSARLPIGLALTVETAEAFATILLGASRGTTFILQPDLLERERLGHIAGQLRAQLDQHEAACAGRPVRGADAALDDGSAA